MGVEDITKNVPPEVLLQIFQHCGKNGGAYGCKTFALIAEVCQRWQTLVRDRALVMIPPLSTIRQSLRFFPLLSDKSVHKSEIKILSDIERRTVHQIEVSNLAIAIFFSQQKGLSSSNQINIIPFQSDIKPKNLEFNERVLRIAWIADHLLAILHNNDVEIHDIHKTDQKKISRTFFEQLIVDPSLLVYSNLFSNCFSFANPESNHIVLASEKKCFEFTKPKGSVKKLCVRDNHVVMLVENLPKSKIRACLNFKHFKTASSISDTLYMQFIDNKKVSEDTDVASEVILREKTNIPRDTKRTKRVIKKGKAKKNGRSEEKAIAILLKKPAKEIASDSSWIVVSTDDQFLVFKALKREMSHVIPYASSNEMMNGQTCVMQNFVLKNNLLSAVLAMKVGENIQKRELVTWNISNGTQLSKISLQDSFLQVDIKLDIAAAVGSDRIEFWRVTNGELIDTLLMENFSENVDEKFCSVKFGDSHLFIKTSVGGYFWDWNQPTNV